MQSIVWSHLAAWLRCDLWSSTHLQNPFEMPRRVLHIEYTARMPALLHVSDMHFSADPGRFRFESPEKLATIIAEAVVGENVDYIVLSGDFTWEAEPTEFNLASRFVEHLGEFLSVPKRRLVLTAGNHDVVWPSGDRKLRYDDRN